MPSLPRAGIPYTVLNGSSHINGSLTSGANYLAGSVSIHGFTSTSGTTLTQGSASYGPTVVTGTMSIAPASTGYAPIFTTHAGSSLWVDPSASIPTALAVMQGNISLGNATTGGSFLMSNAGTTLTIDALAAGNIYSYPTSATNLNSQGNIAVTNAANSSGSITIDCTIPLACPETVSPGSTFTPPLGASASSTYISWGAKTYFTITGTTSCSGAGVTAWMPDTKLTITVPAGANVSLVPGGGSPTISVQPGLHLPALVITDGHATVSAGETLTDADVDVQGTFQSAQSASNSGTFYNDGGLDIQGSINAAGEQLFRHGLTVGTSSIFRSYAGGNITVGGSLSVGSVVSLVGRSVVQGQLNISGTYVQNTTDIVVTGGFGVNGTLSSLGTVLTQGTTHLVGPVLSVGNASVPNGFLDGRLQETHGSVTSQGTFAVVGTVVNVGNVTVNATTFSVVGSTSLAGDQTVSGTLTVQGQSVLTSSAPGNLHLTGTVLLGATSPTTWESQVLGSALVQGVSYLNGTSTFAPQDIEFPPGLSVHGSVVAQGNVTLLATQAFDGSVATRGTARFPGSTLVGTYGLAAPGSVDSVGTTWTEGNVSLQGLLTVGASSFAEAGATSISGALDITGPVSLTGSSVLTTGPAGGLHLAGTVQLGVRGSAWTSQVVGTVFTQGTLFVNGSSNFTGAESTFPPGLSVHGSIEAQGNTTVVGATLFAGTVTTQGSTRFPGMVLNGSFSLDGPGRVATNATSWVQGNVSLAGLLAVGAGDFQESGTSTLAGSVAIAGPVTLSGDSTITTWAPGSLTLSGTIDLGEDAGSWTSQVVGSVVGQGVDFMNGSSTFDGGVATFPTGLSIHGSIDARGNVTVLGSSRYEGSVATQGVARFPGALLVGGFSLTPGGSVTSTGTTWVQGEVDLSGLLTVDAGSFQEVGSSSLSGTLDLDGPVTLQGDAEIATGTGSLRMAGQILMGVAGTQWTSRVEGSVMTQGTIFANGSSTFNATESTFSPGLSVHGLVDSDGAITVQGGTDFSGAVTSDGEAQFPGMTLTGTFHLSAAGGSVNATGSSQVQGNITLDGDLLVGQGSFQEVGSSVITGNLTMTGTVVVNGNSTLSTASGTLLALSGNIYLANAAHIIGNVNTSGDVTIAGAAVLSPTSVVISGSMSLNGTVLSRGIIALKGTADFQGPLSTLGKTSLPGLAVAGNFSLHWGEFVLVGSIDLQGVEVSTGTVVANASGYYVVGTSRIVGTTSAVGSVVVQGASTTVGYVDLGGGSQFGTYVVVNGDLDTGGLDITGPVILPDDTVTFSGPANISGTVWESGLLTSSTAGAVFVGETIINGSADSTSSPTVNGPVVISVVGSYFALELQWSFFLELAALGIVGVVGLVELARWARRRRRPLAEWQRAAVRPLRPLAGTAAAGMLGALGLALGGGFSLGATLAVPGNAASSGWVATLEVLATVLAAGAFSLWIVHRALYRQRVREPPAPPPPPRGPDGTTYGFEYDEEGALVDYLQQYPQYQLPPGRGPP